jgi:hypothetical protein
MPSIPVWKGCNFSTRNATSYFTATSLSTPIPLRTSKVKLGWCTTATPRRKGWRTWTESPRRAVWSLFAGGLGGYARYIAICPADWKYGVSVGEVAEAPLPMSDKVLQWEAKLGMGVKYESNEHDLRTILANGLVRKSANIHSRPPPDSYDRLWLAKHDDQLRDTLLLDIAFPGSPNF